MLDNDGARRWHIAGRLGDLAPSQPDEQMRPWLHCRRISYCTPVSNESYKIVQFTVQKVTAAVVVAAIGAFFES